MAAAGADVEFLAMAMERLTALEARVDTVAALEARVAASEASLAAYKAAMPQPVAYYLTLEVPPWIADSRAARLLEVRRRVLAAVASVTRPGMLSEMFVRCFLGRAHGWHIAVVFITCGTCGPTHDPGALHTALSGCGARVVQWAPIMSSCGFSSTWRTPWCTCPEVAFSCMRATTAVIRSEASAVAEGESRGLLAIVVDVILKHPTDASLQEAGYTLLQLLMIRGDTCAIDDAAAKRVLAWRASSGAAARWA